ncbi:MAG: RNA 2',3'-cyclic phosphodiesterase [Patescibacteria group bacterium]|nr:RNA 2',3'-cyclic phosphodiesterase [Patescibacteria group bacterium]MDD5121543.1 RNA 2',3'-cyclic phosphodiesterase [Patescibacteria group bacterium]MDD5222304.1 RNA 2',3'-cyclic phosphodiesterase [Patescibacteria group bacterium]MDD5396293.1 RNA 2',3'-cyclic phosphodiesterase [Patescibacteria group bacterium]
MDLGHKTRCFIAINLPQNVKDYLAKIIDLLKSNNKDLPIKWVNETGIHLTLHFLGYLNETGVEKVKEIMEKTVNKYSKTKLCLTDLGGFPNLKKPRVIFVGNQEISAKNILYELRRELGALLIPLGVEIDDRPWQMHLTLARLNYPFEFNLPDLKIDKINFTIESIDLMKSELSRAGAKYSVIEKFNLL